MYPWGITLSSISSITHVELSTSFIMINRLSLIAVTL
ncbi:Uncharacterised protein [Chlamydia trachomatis]|nr:Uncharacterised protein [Chlamydia trachomatis]